MISNYICTNCMPLGLRRPWQQRFLRLHRGSPTDSGKIIIYIAMSNCIQSEKGPACRSRFICKMKKVQTDMRHGKDHTHRGNEEKKKMRPLGDKHDDLQKKITQNQRNGFPFKFHHTDFPYSSRIQQRVVINVSFVVFRWLMLIETKRKLFIFIPFTPECWQKMGLWHCLRRHRILRRVGYKTSLRTGLAWSGRGRYPRRLNLLVFRL